MEYDGISASLSLGPVIRLSFCPDTGGGVSRAAGAASGNEDERNHGEKGRHTGVAGDAQQRGGGVGRDGHIDGYSDGYSDGCPPTPTEGVITTLPGYMTDPAADAAIAAVSAGSPRHVRVPVVGFGIKIYWFTL